MRGPYRKRQVAFPPQYTQFKPAGVPSQHLPVIILTVDEFEAIRLADQLGMDHQQAADQMGISRPTFSRLIDRARKKVAQALVEGLVLRIEGGNVDFTHPWYQCDECGNVVAERFLEQPHCPTCGSQRLVPMPGRGHRGGRGRGRKR